MIDVLGPRARPIYEDLRARMEAGRLAVGAALPSQAALAQEYGAALMTVRQALARLEAEGFISTRAGAGTYVESCNPRMLEHVPPAVQSLIDAAPLAIVTYDLANNVTSWNPGAEQLFGWAAEEVLGRPNPAVAPEEYDGYWDVDRRLRLGERIDTFEGNRVRKDGRQVRVCIHLAPIFDGEGKVQGAVAFSSDVTTLPDRMADLRETEQRFQAIFDLAGVGIALRSPEGRFVQGNAALQRFLGYSEEELRQLTFREVTHPHDMEAELQLYAELVAGRRDSYLMEKRYLRKDGRVVWGRLTGTLMRDASGEPQLAIGMIEDITSRKEAETALQERVEQYRQLVEDVSDIVYMTDLSGHVTFVNRRAEKVLGYTREEALSRTIDDVVAPEQLAMSRRMLADKLAGLGTSTSYTLDLITSSGARVPVEVTSRLIVQSGTPVGVQGVARLLA